MSFICGVLCWAAYAVSTHAKSHRPFSCQAGINTARVLAGESGSEALIAFAQALDAPWW